MSHRDPAVVGPAMIDRESVVLPVAVLEGVVPQTVAAVGHAVAARVAGFRDGCESRPVVVVPDCVGEVAVGAGSAVSVAVVPAVVGCPVDRVVVGAADSGAAVNGSEAVHSEGFAAAAPIVDVDGLIVGVAVKRVRENQDSVLILRYLCRSRRSLFVSCAHLTIIKFPNTDKFVNQTGPIAQLPMSRGCNPVCQ